MGASLFCHVAHHQCMECPHAPPLEHFSHFSLSRTCEIISHASLHLTLMVMEATMMRLPWTIQNQMIPMVVMSLLKQLKTVATTTQVDDLEKYTLNKLVETPVDYSPIDYFWPFH